VKIKSSHLKLTERKGEEEVSASSDPNQIDLEQLIDEVEKEKKCTTTQQTKQDNSSKP
tara:strand:- start:192 stop:365 length:174 start_codon:yes stop_codon:yes gene_type:complete